MPIWAYVAIGLGAVLAAGAFGYLGYAARWNCNLKIEERFRSHGD